MARAVSPLLTTVSLALLAEGPLHAYLLKKRIDMSLGKMFTVSEGSLYPLLHLLEERGAIVSRVEPSQNGRPDRVVYEITTAGREELAARLVEPLQSGQLGQMDFYVRVACFNYMPQESRAALLDSRRERMLSEIDALLAARDAVASFPGHVELADLREGQLRAELAWLDDFIEKN